MFFFFLSRKPEDNYIIMRKVHLRYLFVIGPLIPKSWTPKSGLLKLVDETTTTRQRNTIMK